MNLNDSIPDDETAARCIDQDPPGLPVAALCAALALGACGRFDELERVLRSAGGAGVPDATLAECLLMVHLFGGFPRAIESFRALERAAGAPPSIGAGPASPVESLRRRAGAQLFKTIYGEQARTVLDQLARAHPTLAEAILVDAYGRVLSRPGLDLKTRELMAITALACLLLPRQLESHVRGALRAGATLAEIRGAAAIAGSLGGEAAAEAARLAIDRAAARNT